MVSAVGGALGTLAVGVVLLAIAGAAGSIAIRRRRQGQGRRPGPELAAVVDWADACCPACLALAVIESRAA